MCIVGISAKIIRLCCHVQKSKRNLRSMLFKFVTGTIWILFQLSPLCANSQPVNMYSKISNVEKIFIDSLTPKIPAWDSLSDYYCSDLCIDCGCSFENYYERDSTIYCRRHSMYSGKEIICDLVYKFYRTEREIYLYDNMAKKNTTVEKYQNVLRKIYLPR